MGSKKLEFVSVVESSIPGDSWHNERYADEMLMAVHRRYPADATHDKTTYDFASTELISSETRAQKIRRRLGAGCT